MTAGGAGDGSAVELLTRGGPASQPGELLSHPPNVGAHGRRRRGQGGAKGLPGRDQRLPVQAGSILRIRRRAGCMIRPAMASSRSRSRVGS